MEVFRITWADGFNMISPVSKNYPSSRFDGTSLKGNWEPIEMEVVASGANSEDSDCPRWFGGVLVLSKRALELMSDILTEDEVEILPIKCKANEFGFAYDYSIANITKVVDCLDRGKSKIEHYPSSGRIMRIEEFAFDTDKLEGVTAFKIHEQPTVSIFVTARFVQYYRSTDLGGLKFKRVYSGGRSKSRWRIWNR